MKFLFLLAAAALLLPVSVMRSPDDPLAKKIPDTGFDAVILARFATVEGTPSVMIRMPAWELRQGEPKAGALSPQESQQKPIGNVPPEPEAGGLDINVDMDFQLSEFEPLAPITTTLPLRQLKVWNLKGRQLSEQEVRAALSREIPLLALPEPPEAGQPPIDPYYASVLRPDLLFVFAEELIEFGDSSLKIPEFELPSLFDGSPVPAPAAPGTGSER
jgi:hypothetical protein